MIINLLNDNFEKILETDDYISLMWCKRYNDVGGLDLELIATIENLQLFKKNYFITRDDDEAIFRINNIELSTNEDGVNTLLIGGEDCLNILNQRINVDVSYTENDKVQNTFEGTAENYIRDLIIKNVINPDILNRKINNLILGDFKGFTEAVKIQKDFVALGEEIILVSKANYLGCKMSYLNNTFVFDLYKGADRSIDQNINAPVVFSPEYDNLVSSKYTVDASEVKNSVIPYVSGDETSNKYKIEWNTLTDEITNDKFGLNRYETKIDIKSVFDDLEDKTIASFDEGLKTVINKELIHTKPKVSFEGAVDNNNYQYKVDYELGDVVSVENEFGVKANARIVEIIETYNQEGYYLEPVFEYEEIEEVDFSIPALMTTAAMPMATESGLLMAPEQANTVSGKSIKVSELEVASDVSDGCCLPIVSGNETKRVEVGTLKNAIRGEFYVNDNGELVVRYK